MAFDKNKVKNPSMNYISNIDPIAELDENEANNQYKAEKELTIPVVETKSKRLNLLVYPSVAEDIERIAVMKGTKSNNLINQILIEYSKTEESQNYIEAYKKIKG
jgi:hypothetical protein